MKVSKIILVLLKAHIEIVILSMRSMENNGDVDPDGIPLDEAEYNTLGYFLASFRDIQKEIKENENENRNE